MPSRRCSLGAVSPNLDAIVGGREGTPDPVIAPDPHAKLSWVLSEGSIVDVGQIRRKFDRFRRLVRQGEIGLAAKSAGRLIWSTHREYGMRRDLSQPVEVEPARINIRVRPASSRDIELLLSPESGDARSQLWRQERLVVAEIPTCWVAADPDDVPCFMTWVIGSEQNQRMREEIGPAFVRLAEDEVLLDSGFTPQRYRGQRVGPEAVSRILDLVEADVRWAWAYTGLDNRRAQMSLSRAGFEPAAILHSNWRLFRRTNRLESLPAGYVIPSHQ